MPPGTVTPGTVVVVAAVVVEVGTAGSKDTGTKAAAGVVGPARHFPGGKGVSGGDRIAGYPVEAAELESYIARMYAETADFVRAHPLGRDEAAPLD